MKSMRITLQVFAAALLVIAFFAASASACSYSKGDQVFSPWHDPRSYSLAPDGGFEADAAGWSLEGGATVVAGNESSHLGGGGGDSRSLSLPAGSGAVSPSLCLSLETPFLRMMVRNNGDAGSRLVVETLYDGLGVVRSEVVTGAGSGEGWVPTQPLSPALGLAAVTGTESAQVRIRPIGDGGDWQIDDLYVDPFARY